MTNNLIIMLLIAVLVFNAVRLHKRYNLAGLTTFIGCREWYFSDDSPHIHKRVENYFTVIGYNGLTVWSLLFLPIAVKGFYHSTAMYE